ncbi:MAG: MBL fold metallo-hydrolase RNA specificity domain-containing protein [Clostridium fessum]
MKLFGESIEVKARIEKIEGISGHADETGLWSGLAVLWKTVPGLRGTRR